MLDVRRPGAARLHDVGRVGLAVAALAVAVAAVALVIMPPRAVAALPPSGPHLALAAWINAATDTATVLEAPPDVRADLIRDGVAPQRLGPGGTLVVTRGAPGPGRPVARFGDGPDALAVSRTDPDSGREAAVSAAWGASAARQPGRPRRCPGARRAAGRAGRPAGVARARGPRRPPPRARARPPGRVRGGPRPAPAPGRALRAGRGGPRLGAGPTPPFTPLVMTAGNTTALAGGARPVGPPRCHRGDPGVHPGQGHPLVAGLDGPAHGAVEVHDRADLEEVRPQAPSAGRVQALHRSAVRRQGRRRRRPVPPPAREGGGVLRGREVPDPGAGPLPARAADDAGHARAAHP